VAKDFSKQEVQMHYEISKQCGDRCSVLFYLGYSETGHGRKIRQHDPQRNTRKAKDRVMRCPIRDKSN